MTSTEAVIPVSKDLGTSLQRGDLKKAESVVSAEARRLRYGGNDRTSPSILSNDIVTSNSALKNETTDVRLPLVRQETLQEWEGRITAFDAESFTARLVDITSKNDEETEEAVFQKAELSEQDQKMIRENAIFRCVIGYRYQGSTKERFSRIVFRRLPAWSKKDLSAARAKADYILSGLIWD